MKKATVAIVTSGRIKLLQRCIRSLLKQTVHPETIMVIDNDPNKSSEVIQQIFIQHANVIYIHEPICGTSSARNAALKHCQTRYLGFIDDDCVADNQWLETALRIIKRHKCSYVVGKSKLLNSHNNIARAQYDYYSTWFSTLLDSHTRFIQPDGLDTKNVLIDVSAVTDNVIRFDTRYSISTTSGEEDVDFGRQLALVGLKGRYVSDMIVYHKEVEGLVIMLVKAFNKGRLHCILHAKWNKKNFHEQNIDQLEIFCGYLYITIRKIIRIFKLGVLSVFYKFNNWYKVTKNSSVLLLLQEIFDFSYKIGYTIQKQKMRLSYSKTIKGPETIKR